MIIGEDADVGETMISDTSAIDISDRSTRMGKRVNQVVAGRLGRCLLELGGNNAIIVEPSADLDPTLRGVAFGAVEQQVRDVLVRTSLSYKSIVAEFRKTREVYKQFNWKSTSDGLDGSVNR